MNGEDFNELLEDQFNRAARVLKAKAEEYATSDRLHNFKVAAVLKSETPLEALSGMMVKHTVSIYDMIESTSEQQGYSTDMWDEKITDHINYLILLRALVYEEAEARINSKKMRQGDLPSVVTNNMNVTSSEGTPNA